MPRHGKATSIVLGAYPVSQWFMSISSTETQETVDTTPFQVNDKTYLIGPSDAKITASGRYEGDVGQTRNIVYSQIASQTDAVITIGWGMGGPLAGNDAEFGRELITSWNISAPVDGLVANSIDTQVTDGLATGKHLLDLTSRTVTTTGPAILLPLTIPAGLRWAVGFHRTAASGAAASVLKVQTSIDGTTWVDLPGATTSFAALATGSQLVAGTATVAGPYARAVETITGSGASTALAAFGLY